MSIQQAEKLAKLIDASVHPNSSVTLLGIDKYIHNKTQTIDLSATTIQLKDCDLGAISSGNKKIDDAIRVLRLIHIDRQRTLQTKINETLSRVQKITGNPKTDLKIARVGK